MFQLNKNEWDILMSQFVISKNEKRERNKKLPYAFKEQGLAMLSGILNSDKLQIDQNQRKRIGFKPENKKTSSEE